MPEGSVAVTLSGLTITTGRTVARRRVTHAGIKAVLTALGPTVILKGADSATEPVVLILPNGLVFKAVGKGISEGASIDEVVKKTFRLSWITPSGAELNARKRGPSWLIVYVGPADEDRSSESKIFKVICRLLARYTVTRSVSKIMPRTHAARQAMSRWGFVEMDEEGKVVNREVSTS